MKVDHPYALLLLLAVPALAAAALLAARLRRRQWAGFVATRLRPHLVRAASPLARWVALVLLLGAVASLVLAVSRPQADAGTRTEKTVGRNVMIALDLSRSMRVADVKPDRLSQAKVVIYELLEAMPDERFGLIGFAGTSYVYAPLTVDRAAVRETAEQIDENWATIGGSNLASAVRLAIETLKKTGQRNNALVILSDGEQHDGKLDNLSTEAEQAGVYVIAIGVGTEDGDYVPHSDFPGNRMTDRDGRPVISRLQSSGLRKLAKDTGGRFALAGSGTDLTRVVKSVVDDLDAFEIESRERKVVVEFYQWFTLPAILFLMASIFAGTRWRGMGSRPAMARLAPLALAMFLTGTHARADKVSSAKDALRNNRYDEARSTYRELAENTKQPGRRARFHLGEAAAAYGAGEFRDAREAFSGALRSSDDKVAGKGHIGLGNSLFQLGWKALSDSAYPAPGGGKADLEQFDDLMRDLLAGSPADGSGGDDTDIGRTIRPMVTNWTDAVRHYESALELDPGNGSAAHNRDLTMTYLKRLQELLEKEKEETEEQLPQPQSGQGQPQEPDQDGEGGENDEEREGGGDESDDNPQQGGDRDPQDDEGPRDGKKPEQDGEDDSENGPMDPNESPEDRARRILKDNADLEKGPLTPGRREFRDPEKDW